MPWKNSRKEGIFKEICRTFSGRIIEEIPEENITGVTEKTLGKVDGRISGKVL